MSLLAILNFSLCFVFHNRSGPRPWIPGFALARLFPLSNSPSSLPPSTFNLQPPPFSASPSLARHPRNSTLRFHLPEPYSSPPWPPLTSGSGLRLRSNSCSWTRLSRISHPHSTFDFPFPCGSALLLWHVHLEVVAHVIMAHPDLTSHHVNYLIWRYVSLPTLADPR